MQDLSNIGLRSRFRSFPGFPSREKVETYRLGQRGAIQVSLSPGDLITLAAGPAQLWLSAFDTSGSVSTDALGLADVSEVPFHNFDYSEMVGWLGARGLQTESLVASRLEIAEPIVLKATKTIATWIIRPTSSTNVVAGDDPVDVQISVSRHPSGILLPEPLGTVAEEFTVHRGTARAYRLKQGEFVQIIDVEGQQCSDFMAFKSDGLESGNEILIDSTATRSMVRQPYPMPGLFDKFYDGEMNPLLQVVQDTCGRHDTFGLACTARGYEERGFPGHVNCSDNISAAMSPYGVARRNAWPAINFFWNTWVDPHNNHILTEESYSRPGDYVVMRALTDLVCVSTACPDEIDPINGWNPTDVHVRIYKPETAVNRAVAYRPKEDAPMTISRESAFHARTSTLTDHFSPARNLWMPQSFSAKGAIGEYWACREHVTLQDMSSLRKYDIIGPDAERLLQRLITRDLSRLAVWRGTYALICDETGAVLDDGTLFRLGPQLFRWCCGSEESARRIEALAAEEGLQARLTDKSEALANAALQGPKSRDLLSKLLFIQPHVPSLDQLKWFGVTIARLNDREGIPCMVSRTGYTGELGYELFCTPTDAIELWDAIMEAGAAYNVTPMGAEALDMIRIEAGLAAAGAEFGPEHDAWESGLGFAVDMRKPDFVGRSALERNAKDPRKALKGLLFGGDDVPRPGAAVYAEDRQIGHVTSATRSPMLSRGIAMARIAVEYAEDDTSLEVGMMDGRMKRLPATVTSIPFVDPKRERARA